MNCALLDLACHAQGAAWEWWANVGWINKLLILGGIASIIFGVVWSLGGFLKRIGGWPAVVGAFLAILGLVLTLLPRKPAGDLANENVDGPDADPPPKKRKPNPPFEFGVDRDKPKKKPRTLQDLIKGFGS
jgi:hypothetical protein